MKRRALPASLILLSAAFAQEKPATQQANNRTAAPAPIVSPEVRTDNSLTFRFRAPNAKEVTLGLEGRPDAIPMQRDDQGLWTMTTEPLEPDYYGYSFIADGVHLIDPANPLMKPNLLGTTSQVHVPGPKSLPWETNSVP